MAEVPRVKGTDQRSGCLTVLYVVLGLFALMTVTFGVGTCMFMRSETGQKVIRTVGEGISVMREASTAPGTKELRAAGCEIAMVMAFNRIAEVLKEIAPEVAEQATIEQMPGNGTLIMCQLGSNPIESLDCARVARTYGSAVQDAAPRFGVILQESGAREPRCQGIYARDGEFIEPLERKPRNGGSPNETPNEDTPVEAP
jgi:hypothetical protein